jgi:hypothetical protein
MAIGLFSIFAMFGLNSMPYLIPSEMGAFHPLRWFAFVKSLPVLVFAMAIALGIGMGWFIRLVARPQTQHAALAAGAATGLVATLTAFSILGPVMASEKCLNFEMYGLHPVNSQWIDLTPYEKNYLARYLPPELRPAGTPGRDAALRHLQAEAQLTNEMYIAVTVGWVTMICVLVFFVGLALESTWAADYLKRCGRGLVARIGCYLELYPPAAVLIFASVFCVVFASTATSRDWHEGPFHLLLRPVILGAVWVGVAHAGVIRRWHPALRVTVYVLIVGTGVAWMWAFA